MKVARVIPLKRPKRVLGYARVSSLAQTEGTSLEDQQNALRAHAKRQGLSVERMFVEAESGIYEKVERREQMKALLATAHVGDLVLCDKVDRWSRDPEFTYRSMRELAAKGVAVYFVGDACDPATPEGDTMLNFRVLFAREEHKRIKQRLVGTRRLLRDRGYYCEGVPPYGYRRGGGKRSEEKNILVIEPKEAEIVRRMFALCIAGRSLAQIADDVGLVRDRVRDVLRSRVFVGEIQDTSGQWIKAKHEGIVDADTFTRAGAAIDARRLGRQHTEAESETSTWTLRDVARCAHCGGKMAAAYAGPHGPGRRYYYRCWHRCTGAYVPVRAVEAEAVPMFVARLEELREELAREPDRPPTVLGADFAQRRLRLQRKRQRYQEAYADEHMTRDELATAMAKLDAETLRLEAEEQAARRTSPLVDAKVRRAALREVGAIAKAWKLATPQERRAIVRHLAVSVTLAKGEPPRFTWRSAEELASEHA